MLKRVGTTSKQSSNKKRKSRIPADLQILKYPHPKGKVEVNVNGYYDSNSVIIGDFAWKLNLKSEYLFDTHSKVRRHWLSEGSYTVVSLRCRPNSISKDWFCSGEVLLTAGSYSDTEKFRFSRGKVQAQNDYSSEPRGDSLIFYIHEECLEESDCTITAEITIKETGGIKKQDRTDFTLPNQFSDGVIVIDDTQFHINKTYLAINSAYFNIMFFGEFLESKMNSVTLKNVDKEEFIEFLHVIYPSRFPVTEWNLECLLAIGDKFQAHGIMKACEEFLINTDFISDKIKSFLVNKYALNL